MITWPVKDPDEVVSYEVDWSLALVSDEILTSAFVLVSGSASIDLASNTTTVVTAVISGGTDGEAVVFRNTITTVGGSTYEESISLTIRSSEFPIGPTTSTKQAVVEMAFEECGLSGSEFDDNPEERVSALRRLDGIMGRWRTAGMDLGYNFPAIIGQGELADPSGLGDDDLEAAALELATRVAPTIGKTLSVETKRAHASALVALRAKYSVLPTMSLPGGTPLGAGNKQRTRRFSPVA